MLFPFAILLGAVSFAACQVSPPIPLVRTYPGSVYGNGTSSAQIKLEAFLELNCGDSAAAWPELKRVAEHYSPSQLQLIVHQFPLPYHRNGFLSTQGFYVIENEVNDAKWEFMETILENRDDFSGSTNYYFTEEQTTRLLATYAASSTGIDINDFEAALPLYRGQTVFNWKFSTRKGVSGTPWYFVNGIDLGVNPSILLTFDDWRAILDPLLT